MLGAAGFVPETVLGVVAPPERPLEIVLTRGATVTGRVVDGFGAAVAGAMVRAEGAEKPRDVFFQRGRPVFAQTDEDGEFVLSGVAHGAVRVQARGEEFQPGEPLLLDLAPGERRDGVRLELQRGGALAGRVSGPDGEPVADVQVSTSSGRLGFGHGRARSDSEGRYRIGGLRPGAVQVQADHPEYVAAVREATIGAGETRLDLELGRGIEISGRVVDDAGAPVAGAEVSLAGDFRRGYRPPETTAEDGSFRLRGIEPGTWRLEVTAEGLAQAAPDTRYELTASLTGVEVRMTVGGAIVGRVRGLELDELARLDLSANLVTGGRSWRSGSADYEGAYRIEGVSAGKWRVTATLGEGEAMASGEVELAPGQPEARLDLEFASDLVLSGRVTLGGEPVAGAEISLMGTGFARGRTASDGSFRIGRLAAGHYALSVHSSDGLAHRRELDLHGDHEVEVDLEAAEVAGRVVDADGGLPLAGARVELVPAGDEPSGHGNRTESGNPDGAFRLPRVMPGEYLLRVEKDGYAIASRPLAVAAPAGVAGLEVALTPAAGAVLEVSSAGGPPQQVTVAVIDAAAPPDTPPPSVAGGVYFPGEGGRVHLGAVPPGRWRVLVGAPGWAVAAVELTAPGPPVPVALAPEAIVDVRVLPLARALGARARLRAADGRPFLVPGRGTPEAEWPLIFGRRRLNGVPAGAWTLEVVADDGRRWSRPFTAVAGAATEVVVE